MPNLIDPGMATIISAVFSSLSNMAGGRRASVRLEEIAALLEESMRGNREYMERRDELLQQTLRLLEERQGVVIGSLTVSPPANITVVVGSDGAAAELAGVAADAAGAARPAPEGQGVAGQPARRRRVFDGLDEDIARAKATRRG